MIITYLILMGNQIQTNYSNKTDYVVTRRWGDLYTGVKTTDPIKYPGMGGLMQLVRYPDEEPNYRKRIAIAYENAIIEAKNEKELPTEILNVYSKCAEVHNRGLKADIEQLTQCAVETERISRLPALNIPIHNLNLKRQHNHILDLISKGFPLLSRQNNPTLY